MTLTQKFITFNQPDLGEEEMAAVMDVIRSGWIGTGKVAHQFEEEFADFMGGGYAVAVSSCTIGLQMCLEVSQSEEVDVITSPLTFAATLNSIINTGLTAVLSDVDQNGCLDPSKLRIDDRVGAIIPVHYSGTPADVQWIREKAKKITIIEDCAHMFGGKMDRFGDFQVFSFYANKNITCGEGGMILVKDKELADELRILSAQGMSHGAWARYGKGAIKSYSVERIGFKANLPDILAAIGLVQLHRWPEIYEKKTVVWDIYEKEFGHMPLGHSKHFYPLRVKNRDDKRKRLHDWGVGTGIHYKPLHLEPAYEHLGYKRGDFKVAEMWGDTELSLPVSATMTADDAYRVVEAVRD